MAMCFLCGLSHVCLDAGRSISDDDKNLFQAPWYRAEMKKRRAMPVKCLKNGCWIPERGSDILGDAVKSADSIEETGAHFYAKAHISTQPPQPC